MNTKRSAINKRTDSELRVAIIHDWLPLVGGAERVLEQLLEIYPNAEVYTLFDFVSREDAPFLRGRKVSTSFLQKFPKVKNYYRNLLPLLPYAIEQFDLRQYELIISSSSAVAKGIISSPDQLHVCYCHSPMRYAWDLQAHYLKHSGLSSGIRSGFIRYALHKMRMWDVISSNRVDFFIANSSYIGERIKKTYRRESTVINPPVNINRFQIESNKEDFYFAASRQVPYKRIDLIVEAFKLCPDKRLVVIGDGPEHKKIKALAGPNVEILGYQPDAVMVDYMRRAKAFVFAAQEDFGILPVEAQACGTPVIAYGRGGARETVIDKRTGLLFDQQTVPSILHALERFERLKDNFNSAEIRQHAESFSDLRFRQEVKHYIDQRLVEKDRSKFRPPALYGAENIPNLPR